MYPRLLLSANKKGRTYRFIQYFSQKRTSSQKKTRCLSSALGDCGPLMHHAAYASRVDTNTVLMSHGVRRKGSYYDGVPEISTSAHWGLESSLVNFESVPAVESREIQCQGSGPDAWPIALHNVAYGIIVPISLSIPQGSLVICIRHGVDSERAKGLDCQVIRISVIVKKQNQIL
jgi:hypothetical protein